MIKRKLNLDPGGIVTGEYVHRILEVFPELEGKFRQRKTYFEYYCDIHDTEIEISLWHIEELGKRRVGVYFENDEYVTFKD